MQRIINDPRPTWEDTLKRDLPFFPTELPDGTVKSYWTEDAHYRLTLAEVAKLETACAAIFEMLIKAGDYVIDQQDDALWAKFGIPNYAREAVIHSWNDYKGEAPSVYGRYDIRFGGTGHDDESLSVPKLYEFNAQTPTGLPESALIQWTWFEELRGKLEAQTQWNNLHDWLILAWKRNLAKVEGRLGMKPTVYFAASDLDDTGEDVLNVSYLMDTCKQAGYDVRTVWMERILGPEEGIQRFRDPDGVPMDVVFALYPWEMTFRDANGLALAQDILRPGSGKQRGTVWMEPYYKLLWSNKAILPILWKLFGNDSTYGQYLIPSYFQAEMPEGFNDGNYVIKPIFGREGANVTVYRNGISTLALPGHYGQEGSIVQAYAPPPKFTDLHSEQSCYPVLGCWMIDGEVAGCGIRESRGHDNVVTDNLSFFVPHVIGFDAA